MNVRLLMIVGLLGLSIPGVGQIDCTNMIGPELLTNGDFEDRNGCCSDMSSTMGSCVESWVRLHGSPDYRNTTCDQSLFDEVEVLYGVVPDAAAIQILLGAGSANGEGMGSCLTTPLEEALSFRFSLKVASSDLIDPSLRPSGSIALYGWVDCADMEAQTTNIPGCNDNQGNVVKIGTIELSDLTAQKWNTVEFTITPVFDIRAISFQTSCDAEPVNGSEIPGLVIDEMSINEVNFQNGGVSTTMIDTSLCTEDSLFFNDRWISTAGTYRDTIMRSGMCDSIVILELFKIKTLTTVMPLTICDNTYHIHDGDTLRSEGIYEYEYTSKRGCDSTFAISLSVLPSFFGEESLSICQGAEISIGPHMISTSGSYDVQYQASNMCDSIIRYNVTVEPIIVGDTLMVDTMDFYVWRGDTLRMSGIYRDIIKTSGDCDSVVSILLSLSDGCDGMISIDIVQPDCDHSMGSLILSSDVTPTQISLNAGVDTLPLSGDTLSVDIGSYDVEVYYGDGCFVDIGPVEIIAYELPTATWQDKITVTSDTTITLRPEQMNFSPASYQWMVNGVTTCQDCKELGVRVDEDKEVSLTLKDSVGCSVVLTAQICHRPVIVVEETHLFFPTAFSPNADGLNDRYYLSQSTGADFIIDQFQVFDRYGGLMYSIEGVKVADWTGWDGRTHGELVSDGAYAYQAKLTDQSGQTMSRTGSITLVR